MDLRNPAGEIDPDKATQYTDDELAAEEQHLEQVYLEALTARRAGTNPPNFQRAAVELQTLRAHRRQQDENAGTRTLIRIQEP